LELGAAPTKVATDCDVGSKFTWWHALCALTRSRLPVTPSRTSTTLAIFTIYDPYPYFGPDDDFDNPHGGDWLVARLRIAPPPGDVAH
jgi:hypothetical protein